jgi:hypothetical protein
MSNGFVTVDAHQQTSIKNLYCIGEPTGIGGLEKALAEGAGNYKPNTFVPDLAQTFALNPALYQLAQAETIICRCEQVPLSACQNQTNWREAKLQTRCGMGACQGRICGPITERLFNWQQSSVRPPIVPVPARWLSHL